jgi:hypothetical protein
MWAEGLISAAKAVGWYPFALLLHPQYITSAWFSYRGADVLVENANKAVSGNGGLSKKVYIFVKMNFVVFHEPKLLSLYVVFRSLIYIFLKASLRQSAQLRTTFQLLQPT